MGLRVAVVGATGNVGREMLTILEERLFPADEVIAIASRRSVGQEVSYGDKTLKCKDLEQFDFSGVDLVLMSAGGSVSKDWSPKIGATGAVVIDNSSAWRMDPRVPLVVPEVNPDAVMGYSRFHFETFDPSEVLTTIRGNLDSANYAVEDEHGHYRYTGYFPDGTLGAVSEKVSFEELLITHATRVVVISPEHKIEDFLSVVEKMGLHKVSYNVGWTAWLDIAPDGVNKATALERVRELLGVPRSRVMAVGDGRNDIDMLEWASAEGRGVAMGQAPEEVRAVANEQTLSDLDDGVAVLLSAF